MGCLPPLSNHNFFFDDKLSTEEGVGALVTKINCKEVFDGTSYIISCIYPAVSLLQLEILAKRLMDHLVGILAKLILASGLLLVMDLCTFNLIFDSTTNPQGRRKRKRRRRVAQTWCLLLASPDPCPLRTACAHERSDQGLTNLYPTQVTILPFASPWLTH